MKTLVKNIVIIGFALLFNTCNPIACDCWPNLVFSLDIVDEDGNRLVENPSTDSTSILNPRIIPLQHTGFEPELWLFDEEEYSILAGSESIFVLEYDSLRQDTFEVDFLERSTNCCPKLKEIEIRRNGELICDPCEAFEEYRIVLKD